MTEMRLYDIRVSVERIEGRSVCGLDESVIMRIERTAERTLITEDLT
jgi:hypothetical protein